MRPDESVFVDTGAWIALALTRDPLHQRAGEAWGLVVEAGASLYTSVPVVLETFTFLERNARPDVALAWKDALDDLERFDILACFPEDLKEAWVYFQRRDLHKLSAVDATSFVIMTRERIRVALAFDHHFAAVGFQLVG
jgi:uncharacterized protein